MFAILREHLPYIAHGMHVFIGVFKIVREQSVAKAVEIRVYTRAPDMSHRSSLDPSAIHRIPAFTSAADQYAKVI